MRVSDLGFKVEGPGLRIWGLGLGVWGLGIGVWGGGQPHRALKHSRRVGLVVLSKGLGFEV